MDSVACWPHALMCGCLAVLYVGSLYVWRTHRPRNHPVTIQRRFLSILLVCIVSPLFPLVHKHFLAPPSDFHRTPLLTLMGVRWAGLPWAILMPYLLTAVLFLGPLVQQYEAGQWNLYLEPMYWRSGFSDLIWLRNHVVGPFSEEFTFCACMVPMMASCLDTSTLCLRVPLFFGVAHLHHLVERISQGQSVKGAVLASLFQFSYTTVFGVYSVYLFVRTGHLLAPVVAHAFCNHMGLPDLSAVLCERHPRRTMLLALYLVGLTLWFVLLEPLTSPSLYNNSLYKLYLHSAQ